MAPTAPIIRTRVIRDRCRSRSTLRSKAGAPPTPIPSSGDRHVLVIQQGDCVLYELYNAVRTSSGFRVSSSARWDLKVNATRPAGMDLGGRGRAPDPARAAQARRGRRRARSTTRSDSPSRTSAAPTSPPRATAASTPMPALPPYGTASAQGRLPAGPLHRRCARGPHRVQEVRADPGRSGKRLVRDRGIRSRMGERPRSATRSILSAEATSRCCRAER